MRIINTLIQKFPSRDLIDVVHSGIIDKISELLDSYEEIHKY